jgi:hypothetical protein
MRLLIASVISMLVACSGYAVDKSGHYAIWGPGNKSCHSYNLARATDAYDHFKNYLMGYLTAYNYLALETYRIGGEMDINQILFWFDNQCELKPISSFEEAISNFIIEHYDQRLKRPPSSFGR